MRRLLADNGLKPSRALGQNFVVDPNTVERIARLSGVGEGDRVVEIGAGLGSLTVALAATGARVTAIEVDRGIVPVLRRLVEPLGVEVVEDDAMTCDWSALLAGADDWSLVANLPYNVATPLVVEVLRRVPKVRRLLVMVQREAGERLAARPGGDAFGAVSLRIAYFATAAIVGRVGPDVFFPRPKVESVLVAIERRPSPAVAPSVASYDEIDRLVRAGFAQRRKMLRRSLAALGVGEATLEAAGIDPRRRAEELDLDDWGKLVACHRSTSSSPPPS